MTILVLVIVYPDPIGSEAQLGDGLALVNPNIKIKLMEDVRKMIARMHDAIRVLLYMVVTDHEQAPHIF